MQKFTRIAGLLMTGLFIFSLSACNKEPADIAEMPADYDLKSAQSSLPQSKGSPAQKASTLEGAIRTDDKDAIVYFLKQEKADPNQKTEQGEPLLNLAARRGFAFAVEQLLTAGADVNGTDKYGNTALMGLYQEDYSYMSSEGNYEDVFDLLLKAGADVNAHSKDKRNTALQWASYVGNVEDVKKLLAAGADVNAKDEEGNNALVWACVGMDSEGDYDENNKNQIVELLLAAGAAQKNEALVAAIDSDFPNIVKTLWNSRINTKGKNGKRLLMIASKAGLLELVKTLLANGVNVNAIDNTGETALLYAVMPCGVGMCNDKIGVVKVLLAAGANVNVVSQGGQFPLFYAAYTGNTEVVRLLLAAGADVNIKFDGETVLQRAKDEEYTEIVKLLKQAGAKEGTAKSKAETDPWTSQNLTQVELMDQQFLQAAQEGDYELVANLIDVNADINTTDKDGNTPLKLAQKAGNTKIVELLKQAGARE